MRGEAFGVVFCICATVLGVKYFEKSSEDGVLFKAAGDQAVVAAQPTAASISPYNSGYNGYVVTIPEGRHHQYFVTAAVNRRPSEFLVDTGASFVALRRSDAEASGVYVTQSDFVHEVRTANGVTHAALVGIEEIEIDLIRVRDVKAFILPDNQLGTNLLGMSFLSKLESVESRKGELVLRG